MITDEVSYIMSAYGISLDRRHLMLLSDVMTFKVIFALALRIASWDATDILCP